ncbi:MAG: hypothetical protein HY063_00060 [Bacteroidetes bacterium]|nr:hypothetical protein [Bacteroidota bacterium]
MSKRKQKTMIERLREIRDKISLETMDMNFEELEKYFEERRIRHEMKSGNKKYKTTSHAPSIAAEPKEKYGKE